MVESKDAMEELVKERRKILKEFPNLVTYEGLKAFKRIAGVQPMPAAGSPIEDVRVERKFFGSIEEAGEVARRDSARPQHVLDCAVLPHVLRGAWRSAEEHRV
jgi:hypothetical protein